MDKRARTRSYGKLLDTEVYEFEKQCYGIEIRVRKSERSDAYVYTCIHIDPAYDPKEDSLGQKFRDMSEEATGADLTEVMEKLKERIQKRYKNTWTDWIIIRAETSHSSVRRQYSKRRGFSLSIGHIQQNEDESLWRRMIHTSAGDGHGTPEATLVKQTRRFGDDPHANRMHKADYEVRLPYSPELWTRLNALLNQIEMIGDQVADLLRTPDQEVLVNMLMRQNVISFEKGAEET